MEKERDQPGGTAGNLTVKPVYLGQVLNGPDIPRNLPEGKKRRIVEQMLEDEKIQLTRKDVDVSGVEKVYVMPNPVVGEKNPEERRLQKSVYKGKVKIPDRIKSAVDS